MKSILPRHSQTGATIFSTMTALAMETGAVNLSQGFPDFPIDVRLSQLLTEAAKQGFNQYAPSAGLPLLRETISNDLQTRYGITVDENHITVTPGATYGIFAALTAILRAGDEVIVLEPAYDSYIPNIEMCGAIPVPVPLQGPYFSVDWQRVADAITPRTRAIIINTPHNPTGAVWSQQDWNTLSSIVENTDIIILSDEVYEQVIFDKARHISVLQQPALRDRAICIFSFGKVFSNTGWKVGYVVATSALTHAFRMVHQYIAFSVNSPAQHALARYLQLPERENVGAQMEQKRNLFLELIAPLPFTLFQPSGGSYFQLAGYEQISTLPDLQFAEWLAIHHGVAVIPVSPFYHSRQDNKLVRFCFAKSEETLRAAAERLQSLRADNLRLASGSAQKQ